MLFQLNVFSSSSLSLFLGEKGVLFGKSFSKLSFELEISALLILKLDSLSLRLWIRLSLSTGTASSILLNLSRSPGGFKFWSFRLLELLLLLSEFWLLSKWLNYLDPPDNALTELFSSAHSSTNLSINYLWNSLKYSNNLLYFASVTLKTKSPYLRLSSDIL